MKGRVKSANSRLGQLTFSTDSHQNPISCVNQNAHLCTTLAPGQRTLTELFPTPAVSSRPLQMTTTPKSGGNARSSLLLGMDENFRNIPATPASSAKTPTMAHPTTRECEEVDSDELFESPYKDRSQNKDTSARQQRNKLQLRRKDSAGSLLRTQDSDSGRGSQSPSANRPGTRDAYSSNTLPQLDKHQSSAGGSPFRAKPDPAAVALNEKDFLAGDTVNGSGGEEMEEVPNPGSPILVPSRPCTILGRPPPPPPTHSCLFGIEEEPGPSPPSTVASATEGCRSAAASAGTEPPRRRRAPRRPRRPPRTRARQAPAGPPPQTGRTERRRRRPWTSLKPAPESGVRPGRSYTKAAGI